jgi:hypothetical protein
VPSTVIAGRLAALRSDLAAGQRDLATLDEQREILRVALLRISGAVQALADLAETANADADALP